MKLAFTFKVKGAGTVIPLNGKPKKALKSPTETQIFECKIKIHNLAILPKISSTFTNSLVAPISARAEKPK